MTKQEVQALGWAYGRLVAALGDDYDYDRNEIKFREARIRPTTGFVWAYVAVIKNHLMTTKLEQDLSVALSKLVESGSLPTDEDEPMQDLENQKIWQVAYCRGRNGKSLDDDGMV